MADSMSREKEKNWSLGRQFETIWYREQGKKNGEEDVLQEKGKACHLDQLEYLAAPLCIWDGNFDNRGYIDITALNVSTKCI